VPVTAQVPDWTNKGNELLAMNPNTADVSVPTTTEPSGCQLRRPPVKTNRDNQIRVVLAALVFRRRSARQLHALISPS